MVQKGLRMSKEETKKADMAMEEATECHICKKEFSEDNDKVRDHCHFTIRISGNCTR